MPSTTSLAASNFSDALARQPSMLSTASASPSSSVALATGQSSTAAKPSPNRGALDSTYPDSHVSCSSPASSFHHSAYSPRHGHVDGYATESDDSASILTISGHGGSLETLPGWPEPSGEQWIPGTRRTLHAAPSRGSNAEATIDASVAKRSFSSRLQRSHPGSSTNSFKSTGTQLRRYCKGIKGLASVAKQRITHGSVHDLKSEMNIPRYPDRRVRRDSNSAVGSRLSEIYTPLPEV